MDGHLIETLLETGDSFIQLEQRRTDTDPEITRGLYRQHRDTLGELDEFPDYFTAAEKLMEHPQLLYKQGLLRDEAYEQATDYLELLRDNRQRELHDSEFDAAVTTAMKDTESFPRKAIDKDELLDRLYIDSYTAEPEPEEKYI